MSLAIGLAISGCSPVTTYGMKPKQTSPGRYVFTLYYNSDATGKMIDDKAMQIIETIKNGGGYSACTHSRGELKPPWRIKEIKIHVVCDN